MATPRWYYTHNGKQKLGPFSSAQIKTLAASGEILPDDMLLQEGRSRWTPARSVKGLFPAREIHAPPRKPVWPWLAFGAGVALVTSLIVLVILVFGGKREPGEQQVGSVEPDKQQAAKQVQKEPVAPAQESPSDNPGKVPEPAPDKEAEKSPEQPPEKAAEKTPEAPPEKTPEKPKPPEPPVPKKTPTKEEGKKAAEAAPPAVKQSGEEMPPPQPKKPAATKPDPVKEGVVRILVDTAKGHINEKKYEEAARSLEQAVKLIPDHPEARALLAQVRSALGLPPEETSPGKGDAPKGEAGKGDQPPPRSELDELLLLGNQSLLTDDLDLASEALLAAAQLAPRGDAVLAALADLDKARREADANYARLQNVYATNLKAGVASSASAQKQAQAVKAAQLCRSAVGLLRAAVDAARELAADYPETAELLPSAEAELRTALKAQQQADLVVRVQGMVKEVQNLTEARKIKKAIDKFKEVRKLAPDDPGLAAAGQELERAIKEGPGIELAVPATAVLPPNTKLLLTIKLVRKNGGFRGPVSVGLQGLPDGVTISPAYVTLKGGQTDAQFQLSTATSVQPRAYRVGAIGRISPEETVAAEFKLIVPGQKR